MHLYCLSLFFVNQFHTSWTPLIVQHWLQSAPVFLGLSCPALPTVCHSVPLSPIHLPMQVPLSHALFISTWNFRISLSWRPLCCAWAVDPSWGGNPSTSGPIFPEVPMTVALGGLAISPSLPSTDLSPDPSLPPKLLLQSYLCPHSTPKASLGPLVLLQCTSMIL